MVCFSGLTPKVKSLPASNRNEMNTIEQHFENKPESILLIYDKLLSELRRFGRVF